jgi:opacity protein-like surface antigen
MSLTTVMVNGYYDFPITNSDGSRSRWSPYIGAGIGYANLNLPSCGGSGCFSGGSTGGFAYQGNVGLSYQVTDRSQAFVETGYLGSTSGNVDNVSFGNFNSWRVFLGWRQGFGGSPKTTTASAAEPAPQQESNPSSQPPVRGLW